MAWVNPRVSRAVPAPIPMETRTCDTHGLPVKNNQKISQNGQELSELWSKHSQFMVLSITHQYLTVLALFWLFLLLTGREINTHTHTCHYHTCDPCGFCKPMPFPRPQGCGHLLRSHGHHMVITQPHATQATSLVGHLAGGPGT